jgi:hypothetical protein
MSRIQKLQSRREEVLGELAAIRSLRKGNFNEQWFPVIRDGKKTKDLRGPYFVWSHKVGKKTVSERLKDEQAVALAQQDGANYRRFRELCKELEDLTAALGEAERHEDVAEEALKKTPKSQSRKAGK